MESSVAMGGGGGSAQSSLSCLSGALFKQGSHSSLGSVGALAHGSDTCHRSRAGSHPAVSAGGASLCSVQQHPPPPTR